MINYLVEEKFRGYSWCARMIRSLLAEARRKRMELREIPDLEAADPDTTCVLLLGGSRGWIESLAEQAANRGIYPVALSNRQLEESRILLSTVMMDVHSSMQLAMDYLKSLGRTRIALYGVNPSAASDPWRVQRFAAAGGSREDVFYLSENLEQTFRQFYPMISRYDGVICASDYAAISLLQHLQKQAYPVPERLYMVSYGNMKLAQMTKPSITSISDAYDQVGMAALSLCALVEKSEAIANVIIYLRCRLCIRQTTENRPYVKAAPEAQARAYPENRFFRDPEVEKLAALENLFSQCDEVDRQLIRLMIRRKSYAAMAETCFISESAVKYRIQKMEKICGVTSREALLAQIQDFCSGNK